MNIFIKNSDELKNVLGPILFSVVKTIRKPTMKRLPFHVSIRKDKPQFFLDDGGTLFAYLVSPSGEILSESYCGSGDSVLNHFRVQLGKGNIDPGDYFILFVEKSPSSGNSPWSLTIVTHNFTNPLE